MKNWLCSRDCPRVHDWMIPDTWDCVLPGPAPALATATNLSGPQFLCGETVQKIKLSSRFSKIWKVLFQ